MTTLDDSPRTDLSLVADVRDGWRDAFGELYRRHHGAALRFALMLTGGDEAQAQDLVAEAFARVLRATSDGGGSTVAFRPYLLSAVRHEYLAELRRTGRIDLVESADELDGVSFDGIPGDRIEDPTLTSAFRRLPARWRDVLWHTEVRGDKPADVASIMGISANAAAALAARAREGLRQEYLQEHVAGARRECRPYASRLARLVRGVLSPREQQLVEAHVRGCGDCARAKAELRGLNGRMRSVIPIIIGAGALWPGQGIPSLSALPAAAGGGSSWAGSACIAGTGAVAAPASVATTTAGIGVAGVVTAGFTKVAATAAAVVAGSAAAFGVAAHPAPVVDGGGEPLVAITPTSEVFAPEAPLETVAAGPEAGTPEEGTVSGESAPADADLTGSTASEVASSLMAPDQVTSEVTDPLGDAGGPPDAPVSTGEPTDSQAPSTDTSSAPAAGSDGSSPTAGSGSGGASESSGSSGSSPSPPGGSGDGGSTGGDKQTPAPGGGDAGDGGKPSANPNPGGSAESSAPDAGADASAHAASARAFLKEWRKAHGSDKKWKNAKAHRSGEWRWPSLRWIWRR